MVRPGRDLLSGSVEIDGTSEGGKAEGTRGRGADKKHIVVIAAEEAGNGRGRIRLRRVDDVSQTSLLSLIQEVIEPGSVIHTDDWQACGRLSTLEYKPTVTVVKRSAPMASEWLPRVHRVASLLKRWLLGTHQGAVGGTPLDYSLDEFTFGSIGELRSRGMLFCRLVQQPMQVDPVMWKTIASGNQSQPE